MKFRLALIAYNFGLVVLSVLTAPAWLLKMTRRGGWGSGLSERVGFYDRDPEFERQGSVYFHAVSVGEVLLALKLIEAWSEETEDHFVLAPTTATGMQIAREKAPDYVRVVYAPIDVPFLVRRAFLRFSPRAIVLIESELWPNLILTADQLKIPIGIANARLSPRSGERLLKFQSLVGPFISKFDRIGVPEEEDVSRWESIGARSEAIVVTGNVKFDPQGASAPELRTDFSKMLASFGTKKILMAVSTFSGEEEFFAKAFLKIPNSLPVIVPRHAERRSEVKKALEFIFENRVILRSDFSNPTGNEIFVIDSTGELRNWTAHADVVVIGKSILSKGGQNPAEAIQANIPVIAGPYMANFEPLVTELQNVRAIQTVATQEELVTALHLALEEPSQFTAPATEVLLKHEGAVARTIALF